MIVCVCTVVWCVRVHGGMVRACARWYGACVCGVNVMPIRAAHGRAAWAVRTHATRAYMNVGAAEGVVDVGAAEGVEVGSGVGNSVGLHEGESVGSGVGEGVGVAVGLDVRSLHSAADNVVTPLTRLQLV